MKKQKKSKIGYKDGIFTLKKSIIKKIANTKKITAAALSTLLNLDITNLTDILKSLADSKHIFLKKKINIEWQLTSEGKIVLKIGSPEFIMFNIIEKKKGILKKKIKTLFANNFKFTWGALIKNNWAKLEKFTGIVKRKAVNVFDDIRKTIFHFERTFKIEKSYKKKLKTRKMLDQKKKKKIIITLGPNFEQPLVFNTISQITPEILMNHTDIDGNWIGPSIRPINLKSCTDFSQLGCLNPLLKVRTEFREILLSMGFKEMSTNKYVVSSFWNFDALFQPQHHPARDAHDSFFLSNPKISKPLSQIKYLKKVKETHENGWKTESIGWRTKWNLNNAFKNLLRTHTTAITSQMLHQLGQEIEFKSVKYFSIDRVFRNETIDATHLAEFHQIEGFIADKNLTLSHLIGTIAYFFKRIGILDVKFKPAFNPYTEPSMEIFGYSKHLEKWIEVGNSGIFRPEMLKPMSFPKNVNVIAWGLGLERPTMIKYGINNIRDLFGYKVNLKMVRNNPIARYQC